MSMVYYVDILSAAVLIRNHTNSQLGGTELPRAPEEGDSTLGLECILCFGPLW